MSLLMSRPTDWVTPPQTFNITRKIMVATQHLCFISTQGVTVYGLETLWHVHVLNVAKIPPWKSFNRSDFLGVFHRLLLLPSGPAKASGTDPSCSVVITNPPHHHLRPPVSTCYELKAGGRLYAERFLTLFNTFSDNPGVTPTDSASCSAGKQRPRTPSSKSVNTQTLGFSGRMVM